MPSAILFDGVCNLCNGFVQFVIARDPAARFRFASLDSPVAVRLLRDAGVRLQGAESVVLIDKGHAFVRSTAVLRIARGLRFPWPLAYGLIVLPRAVRDWAYDVVSRHRYRWFGRRDVCLIPGPELTARFLVDSKPDQPLR